MDSNEFFRKAAAGLFLLAFFIALYPLYVSLHKDTIAKQAELASLLHGTQAVANLGERKKSGGCQYQGPLPDSDCTPGAIFSNTPQETICQSGYSATVRNVSTAEKKTVFEEYGVSYPQPFGSYEVDHLVPLALGGSNDIANLFPEPAEPYPGFKEKDVVENYLHQQVCSGQISLAVAQEKIAKDWFIIYQSLDTKTIEDLKNQFQSWANRKQ